ncbi:MAG: helix-hairpin-helix domain-containing protein [Phycisphaerales bacterium]|nr:helix-hairpin-helix domain-containing protein [Phycisphaerales bacterium]
MNNPPKSFFTFSRKEQYGVIGLISLICIVFAISFFIRNYVQPKVNIDEEKLQLAWQKMQANQEILSDENSASTSSSEPFYFDPNTLDSMGFIQLGLSAKTTKYLLNWRSKGKHFYKKEDFKPLYSLTETEYNRLSPYIQIKESERNNHFTQYEKPLPLPAHINLNKTDSTTLVRLNGIGALLAHKIVDYRRGLGGFLRHEQLLEIYKFPDTTFAYLKEKLTINPSEIEKIKLNSCTEAQLSRHPYIGEKMAKNIILLRSGLKKFDKIEQLRQVPLMNEEKYRKIAAYCAID